MFFFWISSNIRAIRDKYKYKYQVLTFHLSSFSRLKSPLQLVARLKLDPNFICSHFLSFSTAARSEEQKGFCCLLWLNILFVILAQSLQNATFCGEWHKNLPTLSSRDLAGIFTAQSWCSKARVVQRCPKACYSSRWHWPPGVPGPTL